MEENTRLVIEDMVGKTMVSVTDDRYELIFIDTEGTSYRFFHEQDCCENVYIEDICGELEDLVGSPILIAEEVSNIPGFDESVNSYADSYTWTFYKFSTINGSVTVRWFGESNGYYSESVNLHITKSGEN